MTQVHPIKMMMSPGLSLMRRLSWSGRMGLLGAVATLSLLALAVAAQSQAARDAVLLAGLLMAGLVGYLGLACFLSIASTLRTLQQVVHRLAAGDFAARVEVRGNDELAAIGRSLETLAARLSEVVADIRSNAAVVAQAGSQLAGDSRALSERTEAQAANLEQTSASVHELTGAVERSAQGAAQADALAVRVRDIAEAGGAAVQDAVRSMDQIQAGSRRVSEIVGVIEGIAFRTNILALNAAVEAARAGEQGRGFAVVAGEVRTLAQRSAASAREIKQLIGESVRSVSEGAAQVERAHRTFDEIHAGIRDVADRLRGVASNSSQQSDGLGQISQAVRELDQITQHNAQMVDQARHGSAELGERAERLAQTVQSFRLRQGSADEANALVRGAVALYRARGAAALQAISGDAAAWTDRDMYVFAFDRNGVYRAFGGNPAKVGSSVREVRGVDGDKLVADAFACAVRGGGWVDYDFANPATGELTPKTSYVEPVEADLVLGCGVYKRRA